MDTIGTLNKAPTWLAPSSARLQNLTWQPELRLREPNGCDGVAVRDLVASCPPLDVNSLYSYVLQCADYADTCIMAESGDLTVGWVSAYRQPADPATLFIWQVAVHADARGLGLAGKMIFELLDRPGCEGIDCIKTTITPGNSASFALFESVADELQAPINRQAWFKRDEHFQGRHETEKLVTIGPLS